jgi:hypothetical protein
LSIIINLSNA